MRHFELIIIGVTWLWATGMAAITLTWLWHRLTPDLWHWLSETRIHDLGALIVWGLLGYAIGVRLNRTP